MVNDGYSKTKRLTKMSTSCDISRNKTLQSSFVFKTSLKTSPEKNKIEIDFI